MTPGIAAARQFESGAGFLQKIGFVALAGFVYVFVSRLLDVSGGLSHLHLPFVLGSVASAAALFTGRIIEAIKNRIALWYAVLTGLFIAGLPFSFWRGGSLQVLSQDWAHAMMVVLLVAALTVTYSECKTLLNAIALASFTAALLGLLFQGAATADGRLVLVGGGSATRTITRWRCCLSGCRSSGGCTMAAAAPGWCESWPRWASEL